MIVFISDSLGLPRSLPERLKIGELYTNRLKKLIESDTFCCAAGGATVDKIVRAITYFDPEEVSCFVLHYGIVDCAPRLTGRFGHTILQKTGISIPSKIDYFLRKIRNKTFTDQKRFQKMSEYLYEYTKGKCLIVPIVNASNEYEKVLPGIKKKINIYNDILQKSFPDRVLLIDFIEDDIMSDHHHLTAVGHKKLANNLIERLSHF